MAASAAAPRHDYVVIGSGAGGGTLAARLAEQGKRVLVLEAGPDPLDVHDGRTAFDYRVPAFHAEASENRAISWPYHVRHFDDDAACRRDRNWCAQGIFYPRAAALGGCTAHNAMIFLAPPDVDWGALAALTGDQGWSAQSMASHRRAVEACRHRRLRRLLAWFGLDSTGHGWSGWLPVERAMPARALSDLRLVRAIARIALADMGSAGRRWERLRGFLSDWGDPNDRVGEPRDELCYLPLATHRHARFGTRERLVDAQRRSEGRLEIWTDTLATRLVAEDGRVTGVEWARGRGLFQQATGRAAQTGIVGARCEVILAGGAFATPQLLMISGIGDPAIIASLGIEPLVNAPEVGRNLQDRYEIGVVHKAARPLPSLKGARFSPDDALFGKWRRFRIGMYTSNGAALAALRRSSVAAGEAPDLVMMCLLGRFSGYRKGYARETWEGLDGFTWAILKGQTRNRSGSVVPCSCDMRVPPKVNFRNFAEGGDKDLDALVEGIEAARKLSASLQKEGLVGPEEIPGPELRGPALRAWAHDNAWGHHACGTAAIGSVLDPQCRVKGIEALRVVDASIFPRIPGLFIASAVMMAAEKVAADILEGR